MRLSRDAKKRIRKVNIFKQDVNNPSKTIDVMSDVEIIMRPIRAEERTDRADRQLLEADYRALVVIPQYDLSVSHYVRLSNGSELEITDIDNKENDSRILKQHLLLKEVK